MLDGAPDSPGPVGSPGATGAAIPDAPGTRRLHVLHVTVPTDGAVAAGLLDCLGDQVGRGWSVALACPSDGPLGFAARRLGVSVHWWDPGRRPLLGLPGAARRLHRIAVLADPDVVHLHSPEAGLPGRMLLRDRVPTIYQPHGWWLIRSEAGKDEARLASGWRVWERRATRWTSELLCADRAEEEQGRELGMPAERVMVLPAGLDVTRWRAQGPDDRDAARSTHGLGLGPVAVCVGRLSPRRGQGDLLAVWPDIRARVPDAQLVLVGDGPDRDPLARRAADLVGVRLVGERTDVPDWYAAADVVVAPAQSPGLPRPALEAMASARSLVVTGVDGVAEAVPAGAGAVVVPGDGSGLARAVGDRLLDPVQCDEEGRVGRRHVEQHHDSAESARELARLYPGLVASRRR